jgi:hypothetical protein
MQLEYLKLMHGSRSTDADLAESTSLMTDAQGIDGVAYRTSALVEIAYTSLATWHPHYFQG